MTKPLVSDPDFREVMDTFTCLDGGISFVQLARFFTASEAKGTPIVCIHQLAQLIRALPKWDGT